MGCGRALLCILLPPLAVLDYGCGSLVIVTLLTLCGWVPGAIAALVVCQQPPPGARPQYGQPARQESSFEQLVKLVLVAIAVIIVLVTLVGIYGSK